MTPFLLLWSMMMMMMIMVMMMIVVQQDTSIVLALSTFTTTTNSRTWNHHLPPLNYQEGLREDEPNQQPPPSSSQPPSPSPPMKKPISKFSGLMASSTIASRATRTTTVSSNHDDDDDDDDEKDTLPCGWPAIEFQPCSIRSGASQSTSTSTSSSSLSSVSILKALLPDDPCPTTTSMPPSHQPLTPLLHNQRQIYYLSNLLSTTTISNLRTMIQTNPTCQTLLQERDSQCIVIIEDGIKQQENNNVITEYLVPILETQVVPMARQICSNKKDVVIADALIRAYDPSYGSITLPTHYDISSYMSIIIPLNEPKEVQGGLYIQYGADGQQTRQTISFETSGDAILHYYNIMHGVYVPHQPPVEIDGITKKKIRYSLVLWLSESQDALENHKMPWITNDAYTNKSVHAAFIQGNAYKDGLYGTEQNVIKAKYWYEWASNHGHAYSKYVLALLLLKETCNPNTGLTLYDEHPQIVELLCSAALIGLDVAQYELGTYYKQGYCGLKCNIEMSNYCYKLAANQGYIPAIQQTITNK